MRDQWYGDKRDIVKWATLIVLARRRRAKLIWQIAFFNRENKHKDRTLSLGNSKPPIPPEVWQHFRNIHHIQRLQKATGLRIKIFDELWGKGRSSYIKRATQKLAAGRRGRVVVLLDPDTGIARADRAKKEHVSDEEVGEIYRTLRRGDTLVLYQHAQRFKDDWRENTKALFAQAINVPPKKVRTVQSKIASDVAFFVATKNTK